jgi:hypothetical protein
MMDIQLPDVSGLQVTQGGEHLRHIPVIAKKNQAGRMRILYCETIFHRDVPRNCAQLSP